MENIILRVSKNVLRITYKEVLRITYKELQQKKDIPIQNKIPLDVIKLMMTYLEPEQFINFFNINNLDYSMKFKYTMKNINECNKRTYIAIKRLLDLFPNIITEYNFSITKYTFNNDLHPMIHIYCQNYIIFQLCDGMAGLAFSN